jgi:DNA polymerase V
VSVGIAPTKTLAKLARERAKKDTGLDNVLDLASLSAARREPYLLRTPIQDVWGVGWRLTPKLKAEGIFTAYDLAHMRPRRAQQLMGIHGRQMITELNGQACQPLEPLSKIRQSVMHGRMFGHDTSDFNVVEAAIASLTARATFRLRREQLLARTAVVALSGNRHKPGYQRVNHVVRFATPTADTGQVTAALVQATQTAFNPRIMYHRANVLLFDLVSQHHLQPDFFGTVDLEDNSAAATRMAAVDAINNRYGKRTIRYAAEELSQAWKPKHGYRSPRYTSSWAELPTAKILASS